MTDITYNAISPFFGIGQLAIMGVAAWGLYHLLRPLKDTANKEEQYNNVEINALGELVERTQPKITEWTKLQKALAQKSFRKRLEEELVKDFFDNREKIKKVKE